MTANEVLKAIQDHIRTGSDLPDNLNGFNRDELVSIGLLANERCQIERMERVRMLTSEVEKEKDRGLSKDEQWMVSGFDRNRPGMDAARKFMKTI